MAEITIKKINPEKITNIYSGKDRHCRCGCAGEYFKPGSAGFRRGVSRINKMLCEGTAVVEADDNNINLSFGNNRALTAYFD